VNKLEHLLENNRNWSKGIEETKLDFFYNLAQQQNPEYVWIGCSDSRVSANTIVGLMRAKFLSIVISQIWLYTPI
jgi:carbonic anhydrase